MNATHHVLLGSLAIVSALSPGCKSGPSNDEISRAQKEYELAVGLLQEQNPPGAFQHLFKSIELDPDNSNSHLLLGNLYMFRRDDAKAEHHFREALRILKRSPEVRNSLGVLYINQRRYSEAIRELKEATGDLLNREPHLAWGNLGWAYYEMKEYPLAADALAQAVRLQPRFCVGHYRLGQTLLELKDYSKAEEALTAAVEAKDAQCKLLQDAWRLRGEARLRLHRLDAAVGDFERCVEIDSDGEIGRTCRKYLQLGK